MNTTQEDIDKQVARIRSIYRRRSIFPTEDMLLVWDDYLQWETDPSEIERVQERHDQAKQKIDDIVNFEEKFQQAYVELDTNNDL